MSYRFVLAEDSAFSSIVLDTVLGGTSVTLATAQPPARRLRFSITATAIDSVTFTLPPADTFVVPAWAELRTLNDPEGNTIRELRPRFEWTSPAALEPPGPFIYDVAVIRADDDVLELEELGLTTREFTPARDLERNTPYRWRVTARLGSDSAVTESVGTFLIIDDTAPTATLLFQNFPNPFPNVDSGRDVTCIWFDLAVQGRVELDILDIRGHVVQHLVPATAFPAVLRPGRYGRPAVGATGTCDPRLEWDGTASDGTAVPRGIYLARLRTPAGTFFKRIVFLGR